MNSFYENIKDLPSREKLHQLFDYEDGKLINKVTRGNRVKGSVAGGLLNGRYYRLNIDGVSFLLHRLIYQYHYGNLLKENIVDHIDRDPSNNRIENLRIVNLSENGHNRGVQNNNKLGVKGVGTFKDGKYYARIMVNGKYEYLGRYDTVEEAQQAYDNRSNELY